MSQNFELNELSPGGQSTTPWHKNRGLIASPVLRRRTAAGTTAEQPPRARKRGRVDPKPSAARRIGKARNVDDYILREADDEGHGNSLDSHVFDHRHGLAQSIDELRAKVAALQHSDDAGNTQFMENLDELERRLKALEDDCETRGRRFDALEQDYTILREEFDAHTHAPGAVQQAFVDLPSQGVRR